MRMEEALNITIMNGIIDDASLAGDIICIVNVDRGEIINWLEKHKIESYIHYKGKQYFSKYSYPRIFIFQNEDTLNRFIKSLRLADSSMWGFDLNDIFYSLSSTIDEIRIIKNYDYNMIEESIAGLCGFLDMKSFKDGDINKISEGWPIIKINNIDYKYEEMFYCTKLD